jgi:hypothetical protein
MFTTRPFQQKGAQRLRSRTQQSGRGLRLHNLPSSNTGVWHFFKTNPVLFRLLDWVSVLITAGYYKKKNPAPPLTRHSKKLTFAFLSDPQILGGCLTETQSLWI